MPLHATTDDRSVMSASAFRDNRLIRNTLVYALGNALPRAGVFLLLPIYTTLMTPSGVGIFSLVLSLATLLAIVFRLGQEPALLRLHFVYDASRRHLLYATTLWLTIGVALAASTVLAVSMRDVLPVAFVGIAFVPYGLLAIGIAIGNSLQFIPLSWLRAEERIGPYALLTIGLFLVIAATTLVLLGPFRLGPSGALLGQLAGAVLVLAAAAVTVARAGGFRFSVEAARHSLAFGLPLLPHAISVWVLSVSDRWLIGAFLPGSDEKVQTAVGVYWLGYQIATGVSIVATSLQAAWTPTLFRHGNSPAGARAFAGVATSATIAFFGLAGVIAIAAPEIIGLIAPDEYAASVDVLRVSVFASAAYATYMMIVGAVMLSRRTGPLAVITTLSAVLNIALNVVLIPRVGIIGAAWASVIGYGAYALATYVYAKHVYSGRLDALRVIGAWAIAATAASVAWAAAGEAPGRWAIELALVVAVITSSWRLSRRPIGLAREAAAQLAAG